MLRDNLKRLREEQGLTQEELAGRLHVVRQTVSKWEKGSSVPDADMLVALADAFEVTPNDLLAPAAPAADVDRLALQTGLLSEQVHQQQRQFARSRRIAVAALLALAIAVAAMLAFNAATAQAPGEPPHTIVATYTLDGVTPLKLRIFCDNDRYDNVTSLQGTPEATKALAGQTFATGENALDALSAYAEENGGRLLYAERH